MCQKIFVTASLCLVLIAVVAHAGNQEAIDLQYREDYLNIIALGKAKNLDGLLRFADRLDDRRNDTSLEKYGKLIHKIFVSMANDFDETNLVEISRRSATALAFFEEEYAKEVPPESLDPYLNLQGWCLFSKYGGGYYYHRRNLTDAAWVEMRHDIMTSWLKVWQRIEKSLDPNWDPKASISMSADPPNGGMIGMSPDGIKDPALRAQYEAAIQEHAERNQWLWVQHKLHMLREQLAHGLEIIFGEMYSTPPMGHVELQGFLNIYLKDSEAKARFLKAVEVKMSKK